MAAAKPDPIPFDDEPETIGECDDHADALELQRLVDRECAIPEGGLQCFCRNGQPAPPGVPDRLMHAFDPEPIDVDDEGKPTCWVHPLPQQAESLAKVPAKVRKVKRSAVLEKIAAKDAKLAEITERQIAALEEIAARNLES